LNIQPDDPAGLDLEQSGTRICIYDLLGRPVLETSYTKTINVKGLPGGMYILHILNAEQSIYYTHKVLINN